jgi:hypothetical protein
MSEFEMTKNQEVQSITDGVGGDFYFVGRYGVTRIEQCEKSGLHCNIPYLRVWAGENVLAEVCQHHIPFVTFFETKPHDNQ